MRLPGRASGHDEPNPLVYRAPLCSAPPRRGRERDRAHARGGRVTRPLRIELPRAQRDRCRPRTGAARRLRRRARRTRLQAPVAAAAAGAPGRRCSWRTPRSWCPRSPSSPARAQPRVAARSIQPPRRSRPPAGAPHHRAGNARGWRCAADRTHSVRRGLQAQQRTGRGAAGAGARPLRLPRARRGHARLPALEERRHFHRTGHAACEPGMGGSGGVWLRAHYHGRSGRALRRQHPHRGRGDAGERRLSQDPAAAGKGRGPHPHPGCQRAAQGRSRAHLPERR